MFITLKSILRTLVLPPAGLLLLAWAGAWLAARGGGAALRRGGWLLLLGALALLWVLGTPLVSHSLAHAAQRYPPLDPAQAMTAQAIVILGGGDERRAAPEYGGAPAAGLGLLERLAYGAYVARRTHLPVLVTGTPSEALAMRATLARDYGIDTRWFEDRSRDTFQNAQFSAPLLRAAGVTRIVLVTDAGHEWRAAHEFQAAGFEVLPAPAEMWTPRQSGLLCCVPSAAGLARSSDALYEMLGNAARVTLAALHLRRQTP